MTYGYPDWSEKDAKSGVYATGSLVVYKCFDRIERVFKFNSPDEDSASPPENNEQWEYVDDIVYEWTPRAYTIGEIVRYNNLRYVATVRYEEGVAPPNEEVDDDGVRTWMLNYADGTIPVTPFFTKKRFGYLTADDVYPYGNYLEDISHSIIPFPPTNIDPPQYTLFQASDRFASERDEKLNYLDRRPEISRITSSMEAHPYHPTYIKFFEPTSGKAKWTHQSMITDKLFPWVNKNAQGVARTFFTAKRSIPFFNSTFFNYTQISVLTDGVSIEYYPDEVINNLELIMPEYSSLSRVIYDSYYIAVDFVDDIELITPLSVSSSGPVAVSKHPYTQVSNSSGKKMQISVQPVNLICSSIILRLWFLKRHIPCFVFEFDYNNNPIIQCGDPIDKFFKFDFLYDDESRNGTINFTALFKGQPKMVVPNPDYDPTCVEPDPQAGPYNGPQCPPQYILAPDPNGGPDTSIDFTNLLGDDHGETSISLSGWEIL